MLGRLIAVLVFAGCVAVFALGFSQRHLDTGTRLLQALGWTDYPAAHVNAVNQGPGYTTRGRTETGAGADEES